jgi:uncharacterized membrane protein
MIDSWLTTVPLADLVAPAFFLLAWLGYALYADRGHRRPNLTQRMHEYRREWMRCMLARDNRMVDTQIIANLMSSASFFTSTTMFIIAGLIAVLGARDTAMAVLAELPLAVDTSPQLWDLKVLLLIVLFVYAFFKFSWAFRHYNYCLILVGAVPSPDCVTDASRAVAERIARIATSTGRHFNGGLRAYYFGLAALTWFVHPWLFVLLTGWVVWVIYRREFRSRLLRTLAPPEEAAGAPGDLPPAPAR